MNSRRSRRKFVTEAFSGVAGGAVLFSSLGLTSCSTLDDYIFEDDLYIKKQVPIVGGGISGLYLGQLLRKAGNEFKLFEGSSQLGGRIRSSQGIDFGASIFSETDQKLTDLLKEFNMTKDPISKGLFSINGGAETLTSEISKRVAGLIPSRTLRLRSKIVSVSKINSFYEMAVETPQGRRNYVSQKLAIAIPPNQWAKIDGLLKLSEMSWAHQWLETLEVENAIKFQLKTQAKNKPKLIEKSEEGFKIRLLSKGTLGTEAEIFVFGQNKLTPEKINQILVDHFKLNLAGEETDSILDWSQVQLVQGAFFKNKQPFPQQKSETFQVFGDYSSPEKPNTVEGALAEATRVAEILV